MLHIAICDEEKYYKQHLKLFVTNYLKKRKIKFNVDIFDSGEELIKLGSETPKYNIIFLDVKMQEMNGLETAKKIRDVYTEVYIVLVTAFISYALEGYKVDAIRCLIKGHNNFRLSLEECMNTILKRMSSQSIKMKFDFCEGEKELLLDTILYIESNLHKVKFVVMGNDLEKYTQYEKLDKIEELLEPFRFIRTHQSYLVNLKQISNVNNYKVKLINGMDLPISKSKYRTVKETFIAYKSYNNISSIDKKL